MLNDRASSQSFDPGRTSSPQLWTCDGQRDMQVIEEFGGPRLGFAKSPALQI
ncbi:MAG: hypothetical protein ACRDMH_00045 [Solirubrobacterales bacterium]